MYAEESKPDLDTGEYVGERRENRSCLSHDLSNIAQVWSKSFCSFSREEMGFLATLRPLSSRLARFDGGALEEEEGSVAM